MWRLACISGICRVQGSGFRVQGPGTLLNPTNPKNPERRTCPKNLASTVSGFGLGGSLGFKGLWVLGFRVCGVCRFYRLHRFSWGNRVYRVYRALGLGFRI